MLLEYQALLDNVALGIAFVRDGRIAHCNLRLSEMFGWPGEQLAGQPVSRLTAPAAASAESGSLGEKTPGSGPALDTELLLQRRDGSTF